MPTQNLSLSEFLKNSRILIENANNLPEVRPSLEEFGYSAQRMAEGLQLLADAQAMIQKQIQEYGGSYEATEAMKTAWNTADGAYMKTLKIARMVFGEEAKASATLKLYGARKQNMAGWLEQAGAFYGNLTADPSMVDRLAKFGYTTAKIAGEASLVDTVRKSLEAQANGSGRAQQATAARDKKVDELDLWVSDLRTVCRIAFQNHPQELEKLGIAVLNTPRTRKKNAPVPVTAEKT